MLDYALSSQQLAVICALSSGATMTAAAGEAGIHRNTVTNWRRNFLPFQQALAGAQYDRALLFREKIEALADLAVQTIHQILTDEKAPASVRLKAALAIIQTASTPPEPKKQIEIEIQKVQVEPPPMHNLAQSKSAKTPPPSCSAPAAVEPPPVHNPAQSQPVATPPEPSPQPVTPPESVHNPAPTPRRVAAKIGRNELCPCGSGLKYKHCCLDQAAAAA